MEKIKLFVESEKGKEIMIVFIVIFVGLASFGLGRLSVGDKSGGTLKVEYNEPELSSSEAINSPNLVNLGLNDTKMGNSSQKANLGGIKQFFASSRGKKYYPVDCSAGGTIKEENKVWFSSRDEAEGAGYTLSSSCR